MSASNFSSSPNENERFVSATSKKLGTPLLFGITLAQRMVPRLPASFESS